MKILYVTDGSASSHAAAHLLSQIARRDGTEITVLSIASDSSQDANAIVEAAAAELAAAGFQAVPQVGKGRPGDEILRRIERDEFDLTAMGAGHRTVGTLLLGSVSSHILHRSPSSVLIARERPAGEGRILVGVDGSREAERAVTFLIELADPDRSQVEVVSVAEILAPSEFPPAQGYALSLPTGEVKEQMTADSKEFAEEAAGRIRNAGFRVEPHVILGRASNRLLGEAERLSSDLVVVGSRKLGALRRAILGSVSEEVARGARAALVVRGRGG